MGEVKPKKTNIYFTSVSLNGNRYGRGKTDGNRYMVKVLSVKTDGRGETKQPSGIGAHTYLREIE